jgi:5'-nucleotidase
VLDSLAGNRKYLNPIERVNSVAAKLKKDMGCDMVICLNHLRYKCKEDNKIFDINLAKETANIDLIIDGHTHTF